MTEIALWLGMTLMVIGGIALLISITAIVVDVAAFYVVNTIQTIRSRRMK